MKNDIFIINANSASSLLDLLDYEMDGGSIFCIELVFVLEDENSVWRYKR